jgi:chaperonin GroES
MAKVLGLNPHLITPYGNYVFCKILEIEEETLGGIVLPTQVVERDRQMLARVIKTGPGARSNSTGEVLPCISEEGDLVIIQKHAPMEVKLGGEKVHVVFEGDVVGKVSREDEAKLNAMVEELKAKVAAEQAEREAKVGTPVEETEVATVTEMPSGLFLVTSKDGA